MTAYSCDCTGIQQEVDEDASSSSSFATDNVLVANGIQDARPTGISNVESPVSCPPIPTHNAILSKTLGQSVQKGKTSLGAMETTRVLETAPSSINRVKEEVAATTSATSNTFQMTTNSTNAQSFPILDSTAITSEVSTQSDQSFPISLLSKASVKSNKRSRTVDGEDEASVPRKQPKGRPELKKRNSKLPKPLLSRIAAASRLPKRMIPVNDPAPDRIVNPLVDIPLTGGPLSTSDLWKLSSVSYPIPDTYSLSYLARLLGYNVPATLPPIRTTSPVCFVRTQLDQPHELILRIPRAGKRIHFGVDTDEARLMTTTKTGVINTNHVDPFYLTLLEGNYSDDDIKPIASSHLNKIYSTLSSRKPSPLQSTVDQAIFLGLVTDAYHLEGLSGVPNSTSLLSSSSCMSPSNMSHPSPCGVALYLQDQLMAWASYTFLWHPSSCTPKLPPPKYDLILVIDNLQSSSTSILDESFTRITKREEFYFILVTACVLEHARSMHVNYVLAPYATLFQMYFRMRSTMAQSITHRLVCDLHNCSTLYAFCKYREDQQSSAVLDQTQQMQQQQQQQRSQQDCPPIGICHRWLAQLPTASELKRRNPSVTSPTQSVIPPKATQPVPINAGSVESVSPTLHSNDKKLSHASVSSIVKNKAITELAVGPHIGASSVVRHAEPAQENSLVNSEATILVSEPAVIQSSSSMTQSLPSMLNCVLSTPTINTTSMPLAESALPVLSSSCQMTEKGVNVPLSEVFSTSLKSANDKPTNKLKRDASTTSSEPIIQVSSAPPSARAGVARVLAFLRFDGSVITRSASSSVLGQVELKGSLSKLSPKVNTDAIQLNLLRNFSFLPVETSVNDEILEKLKSQQKLLRTTERELHGRVHTLMGHVMKERIEFEALAQSRREEFHILEQYQSMLDRRKEIELAFQQQLEQDMDAVCDVCNDGEVTPDNQILFCEACNVAVHQMCYGIEKIPDGDYYCIACRYLGRDREVINRSGNSSLAPTSIPLSLPISCELCPRKQGAFLRTDVKQGIGEDCKLGKWVHAVCAKWLGLDYVNVPDVVEDVTEWKESFRRNKIKCYLCEGERGCMSKCSVTECTNWIHVTCARAVGTCEVIHGEDVRGAVVENPWCLKCPFHSFINPESVPKKCVSVESLVQLAKGFPPEPVPPPESIKWKPFNNASGPERKLLLQDKAYELGLLSELTTKKLVGVRCDVCEEEIDLKHRLRCHTCDVIVCKDCILSDVDWVEGNGYFKCARCVFVTLKDKAGEEYEKPSCVACYQEAGWLRKGAAKPLNRKGIKALQIGKQLWVHTICTLWNPQLTLSNKTGVVDCSRVDLAYDGSQIESSTRCFICGNSGGLKVNCSHDGCAYYVGGVLTETVFHVTCARAAGFEVNSIVEGTKTQYFVKCYRHSGNEYNLRAKLEDLIEIEKRRSGNKLARIDAPMKFSHASRLLHASIGVLRVLGWAWQWVEHWIDYNSSWEPLLECGEREEEMTKEQLKIVDSTRSSRCEAARSCRLAAFGAALRNRSFDSSSDDDFDRASFDRAILSILKTESLVGPLPSREIEFYRHWLALAYWSKSHLLGFGENKIQIDSSSEFCLNSKDLSPKFCLGKRSLPGSQQSIDDGETDDFLQSDEVITDDMLETLKLNNAISKRQSLPSENIGGMSTNKAAVVTSQKTDRDYDDCEKLELPIDDGLNRKRRRSIIPAKVNSQSVPIKKRQSKRLERNVEEVIDSLEVVSKLNSSNRLPGRKRKAHLAGR